MTNLYLELKKKHQDMVNNFPTFYAFSNKQFEEGMEKMGLKMNETDKICSVGMGGYILKTDVQAFNDMFKQIDEGMKSAINHPETGEQFIYEMFNYELANHEYSYTRELDSTLDALGMSIEDIKKDERLLRGLEKARKNQLNSDY